MRQSICDIKFFLCYGRFFSHFSLYVNCGCFWRTNYRKKNKAGAVAPRLSLYSSFFSLDPQLGLNPTASTANKMFRKYLLYLLGFN